MKHWFWFFYFFCLFLKKTDNTFVFTSLAGSFTRFYRFLLECNVFFFLTRPFCLIRRSSFGQCFSSCVPDCTHGRADLLFRRAYYVFAELLNERIYSSRVKRIGVERSLVDSTLGISLRVATNCYIDCARLHYHCDHNTARQNVSILFNSRKYPSSEISLAFISYPWLFCIMNITAMV